MKVGLDSGVLIASVKKRGEKFHTSALQLSGQILHGGHECVCSALLLIELPGALLSSTKMPVDKVYEVQASVLANFRASIMTYEPYLSRTMDLMIEFRDLKAKRGIGSADFHHIATSREEGCKVFVTTDEKHLLREDSRKALSRYVDIVTPDDALTRLK